MLNIEHRGTEYMFGIERCVEHRPQLLNSFKKQKYLLVCMCGWGALDSAHIGYSKYFHRSVSEDEVGNNCPWRQQWCGCRR